MTVDALIQLRLGTLELHAEIATQPGETLALLGPNGAGKSTVLRSLAGLAPIERGCITIDGTVVDDPARGVFVEPELRPIGMVFQDYLLFDHLTVIENVAFGLRARGTPKARARTTAGDLLDRVGLREYARQRPPALSGGQAQRVALVRALATAPRLLLLDEPLAALDAGTRASVRRDLRGQLASFEGTRILVTHDPIDAYALADRVAIIESGRIVQTGTLGDVTTHPRSRYVADLVGVNLVHGDVVGGVLTTASGARVVIADAQPGRSFAVIRPHSILLTRDAPTSSSVRNVWSGSVADVDRLGDRVRVRVEGTLTLTAEITVGALDSLGLVHGDPIHVAVKATDIEVYPD